MFFSFCGLYFYLWKPHNCTGVYKLTLGLEDDWEPQTDYRTVAIPGDKAKEDYNVYQRRADIHRRILNLGNPDALPPYRELGEEYGVSRTMIQKDVKELRRYIIFCESDPEKLRSKVSSAFEWALEQAKDENDYNAVARILKERYNWAANVGLEEKEPEKHEVEHTGSGADMLRSIYEDVSGDDGDK